MLKHKHNVILCTSFNSFSRFKVKNTKKLKMVGGKGVGMTTKGHLEEDPYGDGILLHPDYSEWFHESTHVIQ